MRQFCLTSAVRFCSSVFLFLGLCLYAHPVLAQKQEVTLSLGGVFSQSVFNQRAKCKFPAISIWKRTTGTALFTQTFPRFTAKSNLSLCPIEA